MHVNFAVRTVVLKALVNVKVYHRNGGRVHVNLAVRTRVLKA